MGTICLKIVLGIVECTQSSIYSILKNSNGGMTWYMYNINILAWSMVDHGIKPWLCQTKDNKTDLWCLSAKHTALRSKSKDWLAWNQDNVFEWSDMSTCRLLFQWASTIKIQTLCVGLPVVQSRLRLFEMQLVLAMI